MGRKLLWRRKGESVSVSTERMGSGGGLRFEGGMGRESSDGGGDRRVSLLSKHQSGVQLAANEIS